MGELEDGVGFTLEGPFSLPDEGGLPITDLTLTEEQGEGTTERRFILDGRDAFIEIDGATYSLPHQMVQQLEGSKITEEGTAFADLDVETWLLDPQLETASNGLETVSGDLDVIAAYDDLLGMAEGFGASIEPLELDERDREHLLSVVREATVDLTTGSEDRLLRDLQIRITLGLDASGDLAEMLDMTGPVTLEMNLSIDDPNEPISVDTPADAVPFDAG